MAYLAVDRAARLPVQSDRILGDAAAGGEGEERGAEGGIDGERVRADGGVPDDGDDAGRGGVARGQLDVRVLGRIPRAAADVVPVLEEMVRPVARADTAGADVRAGSVRADLLPVRDIRKGG